VKDAMIFLYLISPIKCLLRPHLIQSIICRLSICLSAKPKWMIGRYLPIVHTCPFDFMTSLKLHP
jgi:hypothetical protein